MIDTGTVGVWAPEPDAADVPEVARTLEALGYGTLWIGGSPAHDLAAAEAALAATERLVVATGVATIWAGPAAALAARHRELVDRYGHRFLLGLGASHAPLIGDAYRRPYSAMVDYLDALDVAPEPVPTDERVLAALGPKMLTLAATRAAGAHPYLVTPEHTRQAREVLGEGPLLAPEQKVVVGTDPAEARGIARGVLRMYLQLPNYVRNLLRLGFTDDDVAGDGSDRLVDALVAWGTPEQIRARIAEHHAAGADHVAVQALGTGGIPYDQWRALAPTG